ncbi:DUF6635 family protein [Salipiger marinus]|uniref:DUF6635 family protein n=1 Tax=Salipiger marinus TaxID=555512 RepID=UPI004059F906
MRDQIGEDRSRLVAARQAVVRDFVRRHFGLRGTLRLHRAALGADLLRAPANVVLAPVFLMTRLVAMLAMALRLHRLADFLLARQVLLETQVARRVAAEVQGLLDDLQARGLGVAASPQAVSRAVQDYAGVRSAVSEMTTTLLVLVSGYAVFHSATPGILSLAGPIATLRAEAEAIAGFPLGQGLGRMYYAAFPVTLPPWQVVLTGVALAMLASLVTTFAGVLADPVQRATGTHRRRLMWLLDRLDRTEGAGQGLAREHLAARLGDVSDLALSLWRALRG